MSMRVRSLAFVLFVGTLIVAEGQSRDSKLQGQLKQLFPEATAFSPKTGDPPHFKAYGVGQSLVGLAFWTTELEPLERGYDGPIQMLVGMDTRGILTGIIVAGHHEPYGDFSIEPPKFAAQFKGKNIRDPFLPGRDLDAVSRATITMMSATRAIRKSARRVARALLTPSDGAK